MGDGIRRKFEELKRDQPVGIEIGEINFLPKAVVKATGSSSSIWARRSPSSSPCS
jgi:hypothetical protein